MIRTALILSALIAAPAFSAETAAVAEPAASLSAQQGTVLVNQGDQFITATEAQVLNAGDRVMVMEGGVAEITFLDGCVLPLASGSMIEVPALSTCAGTVANVETIGPSYAQAVGSRRSDRNRHAPWIFGAWALGIAIALQEDESFTGTPRSVSP